MLMLILLCALFALMPIGDDNSERKTTPYVTCFLIAANVAVFVLLQGLGGNERFTLGYSVVPTEITHGRDLVGVYNGIPQTAGPNPIFLTILSAMFMHGSLMHLGGNMLYLWIFGDNLEDAMGHFKLLVFYLVCGVVATFAHILADANSLIPSLGASGAIAGVLGGYLLMYPSRQVRAHRLDGNRFDARVDRDRVLGGFAVLQRLRLAGANARRRSRVHGACRRFRSRFSSGQTLRQFALGASRGATRKHASRSFPARRAPEWLKQENSPQRAQRK